MLLGWTKSLGGNEEGNSVCDTDNEGGKEKKWGGGECMYMWNVTGREALFSK